jgi:hypothetical protein
MPLPRRLLVVVLITVSGFLCTGQVSPPIAQAVSGERAKTFTIGGTVTNAATGEPIRRALVHVTPLALGLVENRPTQLAAFTGPDGRFQVGGVAQDKRSSRLKNQVFSMNKHYTLAPMHLKMLPSTLVRARTNSIFS